MLIANRNGMAVPKPLPYDAEVEYLLSTGTQYIDTGIHATQNTTAKIKCAWMNTTNDTAVFGADNGSTWTGFILQQNTGIRFVKGGPTNTFAQRWNLFVAGQMYDIECSQNGVVIDETLYSFNGTPTSEFYVNKPISLFGWWRNTQPWGSNVKIAYVQFFENGSLVSDFIPVRYTNSNGQSEGAMYDRVTKTLFTNQGTGAFLWEEKEGEIPAEYRQVQYIIKDENTLGNVGLCMYPTGVYNDNDWHLETDGYNTAEASGWFWFGANYSSGFWQGYGFCGNYGSCRAVHGDQYSGYWTGIGTGGAGNVLKCDVTSTGTSIDWNGTVKSITSSAGFNNAEIYLMGNGVEYSVANGAGLGETVITQGGIKVAHLYPCVRLSDNAHVFYDTIQNVVREKVGTATTRVIEMWTNPYVTDGLIGMWDGECNAGPGVHNASATTWVDLSGNNRNATLSGAYSWGSNYWHVESVSGQGLATWPAQNLGTDQTIEFVIDPSATSGYGRIIAEGQNVASPVVMGGSGTSKAYLYGYGGDGSSQEISGFSNLDKHLHQIVHPSGGPMKYYIDGVLVWTTNTSSDSTGTTSGYFANRADYGRGIDADYFTMRRYNRVLSDAELAANAAVDADRFGITLASQSS